MCLSGSRPPRRTPQGAAGIDTRQETRLEVHELNLFSPQRHWNYFKLVVCFIIILHYFGRGRGRGGVNLTLLLPSITKLAIVGAGRARPNLTRPNASMRSHKSSPRTPLEEGEGTPRPETALTGPPRSAGALVPHSANETRPPHD